ncbi:MAG: glycosyltransferase family 9 protein [Planctomycetes bacterium]|nr:glycosyltransferase family 9 protein [Planctomycetota bacterium]
MARKPGLATKLALMWARGFARKHPPPGLEPLNTGTRARILVVNTTGIGDTIFCTGPVADLRESFPYAHLEVFVDRRREEIMRHNPRLNGIVTYQGKFKSVGATLKALRAGRFDVAIIQHANDPDVVPMVAKAGIPALVGYASHTFSGLYAVKLSPADRAGGAHTMDARLALTRAIGARGEHWHTEIFPQPADQRAAHDLLARHNLRERAAVALNLGGSVNSKRWPLDNWRALAQRLHERGLATIMVGGPNEKAAAAAVLATLPSSSRAASAAGSLHFMASAALLKACRAHVSADTGLMHAGLALDVPTVALFGPDDPKWTGPYPRQENAVVVQSPAASAGVIDRRKDDGALMRAITVESVLKAFERVQGALQ